MGAVPCRLSPADVRRAVTGRPGIRHHGRPSRIRRPLDRPVRNRPRATPDPPRVLRASAFEDGSQGPPCDPTLSQPPPLSSNAHAQRLPIRLRSNGVLGSVGRVPSDRLIRNQKPLCAEAGIKVFRRRNAAQLRRNPSGLTGLDVELMHGEDSCEYPGRYD